MTNPLDSKKALESLTHRELEILDLCAQHLNSKDIARKLNISPITVDNHFRNILRKLSVPSRSTAVRAFLSNTRDRETLGISPNGTSTMESDAMDDLSIGYANGETSEEAHEQRNSFSDRRARRKGDALWAGLRHYLDVAPIWRRLRNSRKATWTFQALTLTALVIISWPIIKSGLAAMRVFFQRSKF